MPFRAKRAVAWAGSLRWGSCSPVHSFPSGPAFQILFKALKNERIAFGAAQHEAGHRFLRWLFSYRIKFVTVGESNAECFVRYQTRDLKDSSTNLICACSGYAAESVAKICDEAEWLASRDCHRAFEIAKRLSGGDGEAACTLVECARRMAFVILSAHQPKVQRLADALETDRTLSGTEVAAILNGL